MFGWEWEVSHDILPDPPGENSLSSFPSSFLPEAAARRYSSNLLILKNSQYSQKSPVLQSLFDKVAGFEDLQLYWRRSQHSCFPVNISNFLIAFFIEHLWWLLLINTSLRTLHEQIHGSTHKLQAIATIFPWKNYLS